MNRKAIFLLTAVLSCFFCLFVSGCGSDDNADFNIYFAGVGNDCNECFSDNVTLQWYVSEDLSALNKRWQVTIMNEKEALSEFQKFYHSLEEKLNTQVKDGKLKLTGYTYFTLVLSHSVKPGQSYPTISTYKIELSASNQ